MAGDAALIGDKRLEDAKFATRAGRRKHIAALYDIITPWFAGKTRADPGDGNRRACRSARSSAGRGLLEQAMQ
jgi:hypothetical protein